MTFKVILHFITKFRLHNVSIHRNFYQSMVINEFAKSSESLNHVVLFVICRRTSVWSFISVNISEQNKNIELDLDYLVF